MTYNINIKECGKRSTINFETAIEIEKTKLSNSNRFKMFSA